MKSQVKFTLVFVFVLAFLLTLTVIAQGQVTTGGSVGVRAGDIVQAVMVALTSLMVAWMSRG